MALIAKDNGGGGDFTPAPEGTHLAVCNAVIDLGMQKTSFEGKESIKHQVFIRWELPEEPHTYKDSSGVEHTGPLTIGKKYNLTLNEKATLRKDLQAWRGRAFTEQELAGFDLFTVLGVCCQITITHKSIDGKTYANVAAVTGWPKGVERKKAVNPLLKYSADDTADFPNLPDWLKKKIQEQVIDRTHSYDQSPLDGEPAGQERFDDEIPF